MDAQPEQGHYDPEEHSDDDSKTIFVKFLVAMLEDSKNGIPWCLEKAPDENLHQEPPPGVQYDFGHGVCDHDAGSRAI